MTNSIDDSTQNLTGSFQLLRILSGDASNSKHHMSKFVQNLLNFLPQPLHMKS